MCLFLSFCDTFIQRQILIISLVSTKFVVMHPQKWGWLPFGDMKSENIIFAIKIRIQVKITTATKTFCYIEHEKLFKLKK